MVYINSEMKIPGTLENHIQNFRVAFQLHNDQAPPISSFSLLGSDLPKGFSFTWNKTPNPYNAGKACVIWPSISSPRASATISPLTYSAVGDAPIQTSACAVPSSWNTIHLDMHENLSFLSFMSFFDILPYQRGLPWPFYLN